MLTRVLLSVVISAALVPAMAQVTLIGSSMNAELFGPATFLSLSVSNSGPMVPVVFSGEVVTNDGIRLLMFRTAPFQLAGGVHHVRAGSLIMQEFTFGADARARSTAMDHRLPPGTYRYCLRVDPAQSGEFSDELCDGVTADDRMFMDLVYPYDRDTIEELRPTLSWALSGAKLPPGQVARMVLVPLQPGMDAYQSVTSAQPIFVVDELRRLAVPYPVGVPNLERGRCYAWQVERFLENSSIDRTEAWRFCVRQELPPAPDRYVLLGTHITEARVSPLDGRVCFRLDDVYANAMPSCVLLNSEGQVLPLRTPELTEEATLDQDGPGLYALDLARFGVAPGQYTLMITDAKGRSHRLGFEYGR